MSDMLRRIARVALERRLGFVELVGLAELDPGTAFRGATLRGDLSNQDFSGFDFDGATFAESCNLDHADMRHALNVTPEMLKLAQNTATIVPPRGWFWASGRAPAWAEDWGHDTNGPWVTFRVPGTEVTQRMRWCPQGEFMMGSDKDDPTNHGDEHPRHRVTFAQGFWIFETACAEALWEAVMGTPSDTRRGPAFPVTGVRWTDAQAFVQRLNAAVRDLSLGLPSEAAWEYACRAGTGTAYSFGARINKKQVRFGQSFEAGPVPVGTMPANDWGLREMHGNVWEWCEDAYHGTYDEAPADGSARPPGDGAADRVLRGGSWVDDARDVRSAVRADFDPSFRDDDLGFRCARVQSESDRSGGGVAAPADPGKGAQRGAPRPPGAAGDAAPPERRLVIRTRPVEPEKPAWAEKAGTDRFGRWADLAVPTGRGGLVRQRLRLIQPGTFRMGSPDDEPGRYDDEGPVHAVTIAHGFWLFDTPCTQRLWRAVMRGNPSEFKSPLRPVETVSFEDVQAFLSQLNDRVNDLNLTLPSEAQWEYAGRAGTTDSTYAGPLEILGEYNAPVLDRIAWYGGNSGVGFDLPNGWDSSGWPDKQYEHGKAGTRLVKQKDPNPWGLYDMLGNVLEWCEDRWHNDYEGAPADGSARPPSGGATARVIRGGSWGGDARDVGSAVRNHDDPSARSSDVGFRCARVQSDSERA